MKRVSLEQYFPHFKFSRLEFSNLGEKGKEMKLPNHQAINKNTDEENCYVVIKSDYDVEKYMIGFQSSLGYNDFTPACEDKKSAT